MGCEDLLAAEGQELAGQAGGALGRPSGSAPRYSRRGSSGAELAEQQLAVAHDDGQQVVEVVGDAAGQPAHRLHLLGLPQLLFAAV